MTIECMKQATRDDSVPISDVAEWPTLAGEARLSAEAVVATCVSSRMNKAGLVAYCSCGQEDWAEWAYGNYYLGKEPTQVCKGGTRKGQLCSSQVCLSVWVN